MDALEQQPDTRLSLGRIASKRSVVPKARVPARNQEVTSRPTTIVLEDDDEDCQVSSPRSFAQAKASARASPGRGRSTEFIDFLQAAVGGWPQNGAGVRATAVNGSFRRQMLVSGRVGMAAMVDLTGASNGDDCEVVAESVGTFTKRRRPNSASVPFPSWERGHEEEPKPREPSFSCPICMDTLKEETTTICGHIFCRKCIADAVKVQKKCPTCRRKLNASQYHRIYLGSTAT